MPTTTTQPATQRLDVEDDHQREARLGQLLQRIDNNSRSSVKPSISPFAPPHKPAQSSLLSSAVRETHPVDPASELLSRVESFLPQMEAANAELARRMETSPESVNIENLEGGTDEEEEDEDDEDDRQYIEMNLGLGVFDIRRRPDSDSKSNGNSSSSSSTSDSDASASVPPAIRPIRPLPNRARPLGESANTLPDNTDH